MGVLIILLVLGILATARLTRFIVEDRLAVSWRRAVIRKWGEDSLGSYLIHCPWCMSLWIGIPVIGTSVLLPHFFPSLTYWFVAALGILAASYITGLLSKLEE